MSDVRSRLADALRGHRQLGRPYDHECTCGLPLGNNHDDHVADVLLALPGIAIVDTECAVTLRIRDGWWELAFSNGRTASGPVGHAAALLTARLVHGDVVAIETTATANAAEQSS